MWDLRRRFVIRDIRIKFMRVEPGRGEWVNDGFGLMCKEWLMLIPPCVCPEIGIYIRQYVVMSICSKL